MAKRDVATEISRLARERILVLDGAWGTMLHGAGLRPEDYRGSRFASHHLDVAGDPDVLNLTRPELIRDVHERYLAAGADITTTNTFTATSIGQADYGLEDAVHELNVGVNCSLGAKELRPYVAELARIAPCLVSAHPNAGLPNAFGGYDETPEVTSTLLREFASDGLLNIAGSCCGSTPEHTRAIADSVRGLSPRHVPKRRAATRWSGLEPFEIGPDTGFVVIGERTN